MPEFNLLSIIVPPCEGCEEKWAERKHGPKGRGMDAEPAR